MTVKISLTIGYVFRERFSPLQETLKTLYDHTEIEFNLVVIDCKIPLALRMEMDDFLSDKPNVTVLEFDEYILPNAARNRVLEHTRDEYVCLLENNVRVSEGWLLPLIETARQYPSGAIIGPTVLETRKGHEFIHHDPQLDRLEFTGQCGSFSCVFADQPLVSRKLTQRTPMEVPSLECHMIFASRASLQKVYPFNESISTRDCFDMVMRIRHAGLPIIWQPASSVWLSHEGALLPEEYAFWLFTKSVATSIRNNQDVLSTWQVGGIPSTVGMIMRMNYWLDDEIADLYQHGQVPEFYFDILKQTPLATVSEEDDQFWINAPTGERWVCNHSAALIWGLCSEGIPFVNLAYELKRRFPDNAASMIEQCAKAVSELLALRVLYRIPVALP